MTHIYAGAETSGLYRLSPGSEQWEELTSGLPEFTSVCGIAIHPDNPEVVFAGPRMAPTAALTAGIPGSGWITRGWRRQCGALCSVPETRL